MTTLFGGFQVGLYLTCHKCKRRTPSTDERKLTRAGWDAYVHVRRSDGWLQTQLCPRHARWWTLRYWARRFEWRIGRISKRLSPGWGACHRCHTNWNYVHGHITDLADGRGCFPLCEKCWRDLTPQQRVPFYRQLFDEWAAQGCADRDWPQIKEAVLNEEVDKEWPELIDA